MRPGLAVLSLLVVGLACGEESPRAGGEGPGWELPGELACGGPERSDLDGYSPEDFGDLDLAARAIGLVRTREPIRCGGVLIAANIFLSPATCGLSTGGEVEFPPAEPGWPLLVARVAEVLETRLDRDFDYVLVRLVGQVGRERGLIRPWARPLGTGEWAAAIAVQGRETDGMRGPRVDRGPLIEGRERLFLRVASGPASSIPGAPVVDARGFLVGIVRGRDCRGGAPVLEVTSLEAMARLSRTILQLAGGETPLLGDLDGDGRAELVIRTMGLDGTGRWSAWTAEGSPLFVDRRFGRASDRVMLGELDGRPGRELLSWDEGSGLLSATTSTGALLDIHARDGGPGDEPFAADVDADGRDELIVWHPARSSFSARSADGAERVRDLTMGARDRVPLVADFDDDGRADFAGWSSSGAWDIRSSSGGRVFSRTIVVGADGDQPLAASYRGGGAEPSAWRPSSGFLFMPTRDPARSFGAWATRALEWPLAGDVDGDGRFDLSGWDARHRVLRTTMDGWDPTVATASRAMTIPFPGGERLPPGPSLALGARDERAPGAGDGICGRGADWRDTSRQAEDRGASRSLLETMGRAVGALGWATSVLPRDPSRDDSARRAWCSGVLIDVDLMLTAGHCLDASAAERGGVPFPSDGRGSLAPEAVARAMRARFGYALSADGSASAGEDLAVIELVELDLERDYAILRLEGRPGDRFGRARVRARGLGMWERVFLIHHPFGLPQVVSYGEIWPPRDSRMLAYSFADAGPGSSGAGLFDAEGFLVGVHTQDGCGIGGAVPLNRGVDIRDLLLASPALFARAERGARDARSNDFDGDGLADLLLAHGSSSAPDLAILLSDGQGSFAIVDAGRVPGFAGVDTIRLADFDGDRRTDLLFDTDPNFQESRLALSRGDGTFDHRQLSLDPAGVGNAVGRRRALAQDIDGNGRGDLVILETGDDRRMLIALSNGDGSFHVIESPANRSIRDRLNNGELDGADVDGDGKDDLVCSLRNDRLFSEVFYSVGDGDFHRGALGCGARLTWTQVIGDYDGDGQLDVVSYPGGAIIDSMPVDWSCKAYACDCASGRIHGPPFAPDDRTIRLQGDFNGDGRTDLAFVGGADPIRFLFSRGDGSWTSSAPELPGAVAEVVGSEPRAWALDLDGDHLTDIVLVGSNSSQVISLFSRGLGRFEVVEHRDTRLALRLRTAIRVY